MVMVGLLQKDVEWAIFPGFAGILGLFFTASVLTDGSLSVISGGTSSVIASANGVDTGIWTTISLIPELFTIMAFTIAMWKVRKSF